MKDVQKTGQFGTEEDISKTNESQNTKPGGTISNNAKDEFVSFNDSKRAPNGTTIPGAVQLNSTS